jgi:hypothetical protein
MLYLDAPDDVVKINPVDLTYFTQESQSDDGGRLMLDSARVYDHDFAQVGTIDLSTTTYFSVGGALSPDGARAYVLSYPADFLSPSGSPRVWVFDTTQAPASGPSLPILGFFDVADYPSCHTTDLSCNMRTQVIIAPDGQTLFMASNAAVLVVPIPTTF